jgi:hypothetical protein
VLVKYTVILLIPLFLVYGFAKHEGRARFVYLASTVAWMYALFAVSYLPFWNGIDTITRLTFQSHRYVDSFSTVLTSVLPLGITLDQAAFVGWVLFVPIYNYVIWLCAGDIGELLRACFIVMFGFLALGVSNVEGWYVLWPVVLAAAIPRFTERLAAVLLAAGATISAILYGYIWVWMGLKDPHAFTVVNNLSYLITFAPAAVVLTGMIVWKKPHALQSAKEPSRV